MDEAAPEEASQLDSEPGAPAWMVTFADLAILLLSFFVLLLSFSEMDVAKFKQLAGSMRQAFGVQAQIELTSIPKGTSIIATEFSPSDPQPTSRDEIRQFTIDSNKNTLRFADPDRLKELEDAERRRQQALRDARRLAGSLTQEIKEGTVIVRALDNRAVIHILEKGSFGSGSAQVRPDFVPVLKKIGRLIADMGGTVRVSGHTDDVPISTARFRSNWDLSSARAVSVAHALMRLGTVEPARFVINGHADTRPIAANDSTQNRAKNRRVDIAIVHGEREGTIVYSALAPTTEPQAPLGATPMAPTPSLVADDMNIVPGTMFMRSASKEPRKTSTVRGNISP